MIVSVGNTYSPGSLWNLLRAFERAARQDPRIYLVLLGQFRKFGELGRRLDEIMTQFAPLLNVRFFELGTVSLPVMHHYLSACDFVVLPMEDHPIDKARFPIRMGDYLQHRKLIVSNAVGEVGKILRTEKLGLLSEPDDVEQFARNIMAATGTFEGYGKNHAPAFERLLKEYSWTNLAEKWSRIY